MNKKIIIIVTGELAAGKTTYGKKISEILKIPFFSKDKIKELLFETLGNNDTDYETKRKIGASSYSIFYHIIEEEMKAGMPIIAESNFVKESIPIIKNLLKTYDYNSLTLRFEADLTTLHKRFLDREYSDERHSGLVANGMFDNFDDFERVALRTKEFKIGDNEILVDTTDFSKVNTEKIIEDIKLHLTNRNKELER